jgi:hypothetical protein
MDDPGSLQCDIQRLQSQLGHRTGCAGGRGLMRAATRAGKRSHHGAGDQDEYQDEQRDKPAEAPAALSLA